MHICTRCMVKECYSVIALAFPTDIDTDTACSSADVMAACSPIHYFYFEITADVGKGSRFERTKVRLACDK